MTTRTPGTASIASASPSAKRSRAATWFWPKVLSKPSMPGQTMVVRSIASLRALGSGDDSEPNSNSAP